MNYLKRLFQDASGKIISWFSTDDNVLCENNKYLRENLNNIDTEIKSFQKKTDESLETENKEIVKAINEVNEKYDTVSNTVTMNDKTVNEMSKITNVFTIHESEGSYLIVNNKNELEFNPDNRYHCKYTNKIPCKEGDTFLYKGISRSSAIACAFLDANGSVVGSKTLAGQKPIEETIIIPATTAYVIFNSFNYIEQDVTLEIIYKGKTSINTLRTDVDNLQNDVTKIKTNVNGNGVLYGKKLVACGDSFTEGDFTGYTDENGLSGKNSPVIYDKVRGMYKTYPWWIAERNNMTLVNEAKCGTTITYIPQYTNAFSETRYKNLPKDADYILIKFGINDETSHKNAPLGTIDDTTNTTFYGAWNVVLEYLITNHPWAKIGIIVTNGCSVDYVNAIKESAKKWGIPYLDEANGEQVPLLNRTNKSYVCEKARNLRDAQMKVGETNGHPNVKAHEYESTIVENFLKSL